MRSAISDFQSHLQKPGLPVRRLRTIARILGTVRDEDVALAALEELKARAPEEMVEGIERLVEERHGRQAAARAELMKVISTTAIRSFRAEFQARIRTLATVKPKLAAGQII